MPILLMQDTLARTKHQRYSLFTHQSLASLPCGGGRMSRRRSADPTKAISITLPQSLLDNIDDQLTRTSSRSLWIATACKNKLQELQTSSIAEANTRVLMAALTSRTDVDDSLKHLLLQILSQ
jgi:hypothetical protein